MSWNDLIPALEVTLNIPDGWTTKTLKCIQVGDLAVINFDEPNEHLIIHVPTLTWFDRAVPECDCEQEQLIKWCWKVQQGCKSGWDMLALLDNTNYNGHNLDLKLAKENIQEYCLSVKIDDNN